MSDTSKYFEVNEIEGVVEIELGTADFVSRPIISLAVGEMIEYVDANQPSRVVVNFQNVSQISSEFISAMIRFNDHVGGHDGQLRFAHVSDQVLAPFKITNLAGTLFKIHSNTSQAIDSF